VIEQGAQGQASLDAQARHRRIAHVVAGQRIEHPRGDSQLKAILELDDQTIRGLMPSATRLPPTCWKMESTFDALVD
jgi:hypothetical protein